MRGGRLFHALNLTGKQAAASPLHSSSPRRSLCGWVAPCPKVSILGAAGKIGQHLSVFMKLNRLTINLALYDTVPAVHQVVEYVSQLDTRPEVAGYAGGQHELGEALKDSDLVLVTTGAPEPGSGSGLHEFRSLCTAISNHCPDATVNLLNCPYRSVGVAKQIFKELGTYRRNGLYGVVNEVAEEAEASDSLVEDLGPYIDSERYAGIETPEAKDGVASAIAFAGVIGADHALRALLAHDEPLFRVGFPYLELSSTCHIKLIPSEDVLVKDAVKKSGLEELEWFKQWRAERIARRAGGDLKNIAACNSQIC